MEQPAADSLVLYKRRPARVVAVTDKLEIELPGGGARRVRPKDVVPLHPGPLRSLGELRPVEGEIEAACELLAGQTTTVAELAELAFGAFTPATAWAVWERVEEGIELEGEAPDAIRVRTPEEAAAEREAREGRDRRRRAWGELLQRIQAGRVLPEDRPQLADLEGLALGRHEGSRILRALDRAERPEVAHELLLKLGAWGPEVDPHPVREGLPEAPPALELPELAAAPRRDLTALEAFAIDDEGNQDPDDAVSWDGRWLWVHVADAAALVLPGSAADEEARLRGATQYLPHRQVPMLPVQAVQRLGLGLAPVSPALSFGIRMDAEGEILDVAIVPSTVRVRRLSYGEAERRLHEEPFAGLHRLALRLRERRLAAGAVDIRLPEARVRVVAGEVRIEPLPPLASRLLVSELMLRAGEAAARYAAAEGIALPFIAQSPPDEADPGEGLAGMYALRRRMRPRQIVTAPEPHAGLGLAAYCQATSPLRRYTDLLTHQQLRAHVTGGEPLDAETVRARAGAAEQAMAAVRRAERASNRHWTLVWLLRHERWRGEAVVVEPRERRSVVIVPELALEAQVALRGVPQPNERLPVVLTGVDLPNLEARFRLERG
ncbi:RNB domain-containing ribonuclease [Inmirania thermothiophila]|uniref:Exoribonuclease-2 n=1 Tax=Inmirania thermothiophila TaxID=1750597 RepID=A0A3N1Y263_9GAMM|nr:RNB domain-containing ribonuclease [Inmirania thermothiophila]ROR32896.1 exoribonuclease-2 [Inmirania thermothiophila]